jgi:hypothetical protein
LIKLVVENYPVECAIENCPECVIVDSCLQAARCVDAADFPGRLIKAAIGGKAQ